MTSSYNVRTSQIKQTSVCNAETIQLLHVAYTEQSAHQTCSPISTHGVVRLAAKILILIFVFINIRHFVPSQLKQCVSRMFVKITMAMLMGAIFQKIYGDGSQI